MIATIDTNSWHSAVLGNIWIFRMKKKIQKKLVTYCL